MEELLNSAQTLGVFAVFAILVLREVLNHKDRKNGNGNGSASKQIDDLARWQFPRIEEAISQIAKSQVKQTRLLERLTSLINQTRSKK